MTKTIKILGLPGTGKTTLMIEMIKKDIKDGTPLDKICVNTFLRRMSIEVKERLKNEIDVPEDDINDMMTWITTTHGICKRLLGLTKEQIIDLNDRIEFCKIYNIEFEKKQIDSELYNFKSNTLGEQLFNIKKYLVENMLSIDDWVNCPGVDDYQDELSASRVSYFLNKWEEFKKEKGKFDFDDMLYLIYKNKVKPMFNILYWDEYQDVTPIQHEICKMWSKDVKKVVIAGDPNQCIYDFFGASPEFFYELDGETKTLRKSYRLKKEIWNFAKNILPYKLPEIETSPGGEVIRINTDDIEPLLSTIMKNSKNKKISFLLRTNYMCREIESVLNRFGIPFTGVNGWTNKQFVLLDGIIKTRKREEPDEEYLHYLVDGLPSEFFIKKKKKILEESNLTLKKVSSYLQPLNKMEILFNPLDYFLTSKKPREDIIGRIKRVYIRWDYVPRNIEVTTIHKKKGGESDIVVLFNSITNKIEKNLYKNLDSERRIFFTGATRPKEKLYIIDGYFDQPTIDLNNDNE